MKKKELISSLKGNYTTFIDYIDSLTDEAYYYNILEKWNAGLHLGHLVLSVKPLAAVFELDKTIIAEKFGSTIKKGRSYAEMRAFYFEKLNDGGKAPDRFVPNVEMGFTKFALCENLKVLIEKLSTSILSFSEEELDSLCVPHPLLGTLSLREMLYNAIYHAEHHHKLIAKMIHKDFDTIK